MLEVTQTQEHGYTVYKFSANNTEYEVLKDESPFYTVYSQRIGRSGSTAPKTYTLKELSARSKVLRLLAELIAA